MSHRVRLCTCAWAVVCRWFSDQALRSNAAPCVRALAPGWAEWHVAPGAPVTSQSAEPVFIGNTHTHIHTHPDAPTHANSCLCYCVSLVISSHAAACCPFISQFWLTTPLLPTLPTSTTTSLCLRYSSPWSIGAKLWPAGPNLVCCVYLADTESRLGLLVHQHIASTTIAEYFLVFWIVH